MLLSLSLLTFGLCASAAVVPRQTTPCSFSMTAVGPPNGTIVEDTIGENRIGGTYPQGVYTISAHNLTDSLGHKCLIYPSTSQFQCTQGTNGASNFSLADDGSLLFDGKAQWWACPATGPGNDGSFNIFADTKADTTGCQAVTLKTGGFSCAALGSSTSTSATATSSSSPAPSSTTTSSVSCPTDISSGTFQFPHLIIPTSPKAPNHTFGNTYQASISPINTTLFNFDIPSTAPYAASSSCALLFLFPYASSLAPSAGKYYFSGVEEEQGEHGGLDFALLQGIATSATTYSTTPGVAQDYGKTEILPGNNYTVAVFPCQSGKTVTYSASSVGNVELDYFQNSAPSPIGLYVVPCA